MAKKIVIVRYDEIGLKGKNRKFFIDALARNIRNKLKDLNNIKVFTPHGRIIIQMSSENQDHCDTQLRAIPGLVSFSFGVEMERDFDLIAKLGINWIEPILSGRDSLNFCIRTRRSDKSFFKTSTECDFEIGSRIMHDLHPKGLVVDIKNAEYMLEVEIGRNAAWVYSGKIKGQGGLPVGTAGEVLSLLSGGIDSPVASHMLIRRGCRVSFIFFENRAFLGKGGFEKVLRLAKLLNRFQDNSRLCVVPFGDIQMAIRDNCRAENRVVLYRRMMYRIAEYLSKKLGYKALITGESLGQVASQTLENLAAVSDVVKSSVFRPLIGMDKIDIIGRAQEIGTYEISIEPHLDCCSIFMPPNPATKVKIPILEDDETRFDYQGLMKEAMENLEWIELEKL
jgi:thiamine biosynthesis protein ThiI